MALFKKKKPESVQKYSGVEQNVTPELPPPIPIEAEQEEECVFCTKIRQKIDNALDNQKVIVQNQQTILDAIQMLQELIVKLAGSETEVELTDEEMQQAIQEAKAAKRKGTA